ncbi:MAG: DUF1592 domain-containing protein, partial [Planctomycetota bacterium]
MPYSRDRTSIAFCWLITGLVLSLMMSRRSFGNASLVDDAVQRTTKFVRTYCLDCHNSDDAIQDLDLESTPIDQIDFRDSKARQSWELVWKRVASHQMPPPDADRPTRFGLRRAADDLAVILDAGAELDGQLPPMASLRRLTRTEYQNSIRDLLSLDIDASRWLPKDESSAGFDNITVGELSPALLSRYLTAAEKIARLAVGRPTSAPVGVNVRLPADLTQERHMPGLPLGTRGGTAIKHTFAESGQYEVAIRLTRDRDEKIEGLHRSHDLDILVDRMRVHRFHIEPPKGGRDYTHVDTGLVARVPIQAGPREIAVTFPSTGESILMTKRQPFEAAYNRHRHPRQQPAIFEINLVGPLSDSTTEVDTPSRQKVFSHRPATWSWHDQVESARAILTPILRQAYRRPVQDADLREAMTFFSSIVRPANEDHSVADRDRVVASTNLDENDRFEAGIESSIASILVNPHFLFRIEAPGRTHQSNQRPLNSHELATRLAAFLWSSLPDDRLLDLAESGQLVEPENLTAEVNRMLKDSRSDSLVTHFASQWLYLRNLDSLSPDLRAFPDYDSNLKRAFRGETEHLFRHMMRQDASVMSLFVSDFTFLNERLARHYGIGGVLGSHFRKVSLPADSNRGGILRHGSILAVTSYATRTSPTIRGNWILENIIGTPPPPPPPDVPTLRASSPLEA